MTRIDTGDQPVPGQGRAPTTHPDRPAPPTGRASHPETEPHEAPKSSGATTDPAAGEIVSPQGAPSNECCQCTRRTQGGSQLPGRVL